MSDSSTLDSFFTKEEQKESKKEVFKELKKTKEQKELPDEKLHYNEDKKEWQEIVNLCKNRKSKK